ncbi:MAG: hypothetical protein D6816_19570 [Bacteroidetes bacterium]|nr:MAG: hypothetical protein D6816_19570 [Bacteroidota bacterium]
MSNQLKAIDLFCGAGGSSYGARKAGVEIVAWFNIWKPAIKTYQANSSQTGIMHVRKADRHLCVK